MSLPKALLGIWFIELFCKNLKEEKKSKLIIRYMDTQTKPYYKLQGIAFSVSSWVEKKENKNIAVSEGERFLRIADKNS